MQRIIVLGPGFAGLWSAVGAARALDERGIGPDQIAVTVVNATPQHAIRVRSYEADLSDTRAPLADVLEPIGLSLVVAEITDISVADRNVTCVGAGKSMRLAYDRMVFASAAACVDRRFQDCASTRSMSTHMRRQRGSGRISRNSPAGHARPSVTPCELSERG